MSTKGQFKRTVEELVASARRFETIGDWKKGDVNAYATASWRKDAFALCTAHMRRKIRIYGGGAYTIYVYDFADGFSYVGLTCTPDRRKLGHLVKGPVFEHAKICPNPTYRELVTGLNSPEEAIVHEAAQIEILRTTRKLLNSANAGSIGSVALRKWTLAKLLEDALRFTHKNNWRLESQYAYREAKRRGCFDQCTTHML